MNPRSAPSCGLGAASSAAFVLVLAASGCRGGGGYERTGPDFAVEFPDAGELVTTTDVEATRRRLANVQLPTTAAHHDRLRALLAEREQISAGHLLLLVEAVSLPDGSIIYVVDGVVRRFAPRGQGEFAPVVDELLMAGCDKLVDVDAERLGELIGRSQSDEVMTLLAQRWLPEVDDGSAHSLDALIDGLGGSPARMPFVLGHLVSSGRLDGAHGWALVGRLSFDSERIALVRALSSRRDSIDEGDMLTALGAMSFDSGRTGVVEAVAPRLTSLSPEAAVGAVAVFSFDDGRRDAVAVLARAARLQPDHRLLASLVGLCSFDQTRVEVVRVLAPRLSGDPDAALALALLRTLSFDSGRVEVLQAMAPHWRDLPESARERIAGSMAFSSNRDGARARLGLR